MDEEIKNLMAKLRKQNNNSNSSSSSAPRFTNSLTKANNTLKLAINDTKGASQILQMHTKKQKTQRELDSDEELEREILEFNENVMDAKPADLNLNTNSKSIQLNTDNPIVTASRPVIVSKPKKLSKINDLDLDLDEDLESLMDEICGSPEKLDSNNLSKKPNMSTTARNNISKPTFLNEAISLSQQKSKLQQNSDDLDDLEKELLELDAELDLDFNPIISAPTPNTNKVQITSKPTNRTVESPQAKPDILKRKPQKESLADDNGVDALYRELMELDEIETETSPKKIKLNSATHTVEQIDKSSVNISKVDSNNPAASNQSTRSGFKFSNSSQSSTSNHSVASKIPPNLPINQIRNTLSKSPISNGSAQSNSQSRQIPSTSSPRKFSNRPPTSLEPGKSDASRGFGSKTPSFETPRNFSNPSSTSQSANFTSNLKNASVNTNISTSGLSDDSIQISSNTSPTKAKKVGFTPQNHPFPRKLCGEDPTQPIINIGPPGPAGFYAQFGQRIRYTDLTHTQVDKRPGEGEESGGFSKRMKSMELERAQMEEWHLLRKSGWPNFLYHYEKGENKEFGLSIQSNSIDKIHSGQYKELRVPYLALVIKTIEYFDSDGGVGFFDSTNRIDSSVSQSLIEEYEHYCKPGMVWVLENPTLYKPKKGGYHLVVHHSNLVQVFLAGKKADGTIQEPINIREFKPSNPDDQFSTRNQSASLYDISETDLISINGTGEGQQADKWNEYLDDDEFGDFDDLF